MRRLNCWEYKMCGKAAGAGSSGTPCPASVETLLDGVHGGARAGRVCWTVAGTLCRGTSMGSFDRKASLCIRCDFYKEVKEQEGEAFMDIPDILRHVESGAGILCAPSDEMSPDLREALEKDFSRSLVTGLRSVRDGCEYFEPRFAHMVADLGAVKAVKRMLNKQQFLFGISLISRCGCAASSPERLVLDSRFSPLFTEGERMAALTRLRSSGPGSLRSLLMGKDPDTVQ